MFLPSGRVHAVGAGLVIFEIQQNSDTTYRVFDWNRVGLDGKPRDLHVSQSLASINFEDFEPELTPTAPTKAEPFTGRPVINCPLFDVVNFHVASAGSMLLNLDKVRIIGVINGRVVVTDGKQSSELKPGDFCLIPAKVKPSEAWFDAGSTFLSIGLGA
jgi:mannose-6-phosphate isomerase